MYGLFLATRFEIENKTWTMKIRHWGSAFYISTLETQYFLIGLYIYLHKNKLFQLNEIELNSYGNKSQRYPDKIIVDIRVHGTRTECVLYFSSTLLFSPFSKKLFLRQYINWPHWFHELTKVFMDDSRPTYGFNLESNS